MISEGQATILETSPPIIALICLFFLVVTISFELLLKIIYKVLKKLGDKRGLIAAMDRMKSELMMLGVASLILLIFESRITGYSVRASSGSKTWLDHVQGCACCLPKTSSVTACYLAAKGCTSREVLNECCSPGYDKQQIMKACSIAFDDTADWTNKTSMGAYQVNVRSGKITPNTHNRRRLLVEVEDMMGEYEQCYERYKSGYEECGFAVDMKPAISSTVLTELHIYLFSAALAHIVTSVIVILMATFRLHMWQHMQGREKDHLLMVQAVVDDFWKEEDALQSARRSEDQLHASNSQKSKAGSSSPSIPTSSSAPPDVPFLPASIKVMRPKPWTGRPTKLRGFGPRTREFLICCGRHFLRKVITEAEFCLIESGFILSHGIRSRNDEKFNFLEYLKRAVQKDFSKVVGLSVPLWIFIILFVLLSSAIGWAIWVFVIFAGALLFIINTKLIWIVRYASRGGDVHRISPHIFWLHRPRLLIPIIQFLLFFIAFEYVNAIFFAIRFGPKSCYFSTTGFQSTPIPWWVLIVVNTIYLASLGYCTLPLYSITVQLAGDFKSGLLAVDREVAKAIRTDADVVAQKHIVLLRPSRGFKRLVSKFVPAERNRIAKEGREINGTAE